MSTSTTQVKKVMISSTARDLPEHRKQVMDACLRQSMLPKMMEHLPANDLEAISASLKMVDEADIYIGVFAFRYGYVPKEGNPDQISVTEMEYRRAKERGIPRLIFIMDKGHPISFDDVEMGESAEKLKVFKEKVGTENIANFFKSPEELRAVVIYSLSSLKERNFVKSTRLRSAKEKSSKGDKGLKNPKENKKLDFTRKVFISYNQEDTEIMEKVKNELLEAGVEVHVDIYDMSAGQDIQEFIVAALKNNDIVLSIVSQNSLLSGWVNYEMSFARVLNTFYKNWIPVLIDDSCFNHDFFFEANQSINAKIETLHSLIIRAINEKVSIYVFIEELKRMEDVKSNIASNLVELKKRLIVDIRESDGNFKKGMQKVLKRIKSEFAEVPT